MESTAQRIHEGLDILVHYSYVVNIILPKEKNRRPRIHESKIQKSHPGHKLQKLENTHTAHEDQK